MLTLTQCVERLKELDYTADPSRSLSQVSRVTMIGRDTISRIKNGHITNPSYLTVKTLSDYFEAN